MDPPAVGAELGRSTSRGVRSSVTVRIVDEQMREYYDRRAREYDDWWHGTGRFAQRDRPGWAEETARLIATLRALPAAHVLDVACGTGFLTRHLRGEVVAIDQSEEMVRIARARMPHARVLCTDAVPLPFADGAFDRLVTGHFYGHLLPEERVAFVAEARRVASELVVVDSALRRGVPEEEWQERVLDDGSRHRVFKRFLSSRRLREELGDGDVLHEGEWFVVYRCAGDSLRTA
jgi:demethylmenaquinone methyltransferase/2-methoxy-6-polyprenyl-1,4-benzoquinol methylase